MSKFQIKLLTSRLNTTNNVVNFVETPISEFSDQLGVFRGLENNFLDRDHVYCYSFNEKASFHTNGQKELSFSMLKNIWQDGEMILNPFVNQLKNGSQVLLIDQYDNEYFFTIKDIKYDLKQSNIVYNYSCQDSFTYQHIRQHSGYVIQNNANESDFIGAKNIDWWVQNKIQPECHITYQYIPLDTGLYLSTNSKNITLYNKYSNLHNVEKIIKQPYLQNEYPEYYETIPFSVSGSNASSALISLGEELGLMLNFREHNLRDSNGKRTNSFVRYFWFEPKKNEKTADLKYSPYSNIQSFSFSHGGSSLATSYSIESNTIDDEVISLFPNIPPFFSFMFSSNSWKDSLFTDGFFTSACQHKIFLCKDGLGRDNEFRFLLDTNGTVTSTSPGNGSWRGAGYQDSSNSENSDNSKYIYFQIRNTSNGFKIPEFYNKISLADEYEQSELEINGRHVFAKNSTWEFVICEFYKDVDNNIKLKNHPLVYNDTYSLLPEDLLNKELIQTLEDNTTKIPQCYLRLKVSEEESSTPPNLTKTKVVLRFYRDATEEELEFAEIADKCPWLENKLLDFSYFVNHQIISPEEYGALMNTLKNNLRIVNGQLMYYSREYYQAIHTKTAVLADLTNTLDVIGAAFNSDVVEAYKTSGYIENLEYFDKAYATMLEKYFKTDTTTPIINYDELLTEYFNKYFSAQQRFFKNIYNFKKFFNQKTHWSGNVWLYKNKITLKTVEDPISVDNKVVKNYWSFQDYTSFKQIDDNFKLYNQESLKPNVKLFAADKITELLVVDKENCTGFYKPEIKERDLVRCDSEKYNPGQLYYRVAYEVDVNTVFDGDSFKTGWSEIIGDWVYYKKDDTKAYYCSLAPISNRATGNDTWSKTIKLNNTDLNRTYLHAPYNDIVNEYLYSLLYNDDTYDAETETYTPKNEYRGKLIYKSKNTQTSTSVWWSDDEIKTNLQKFTKAVLANNVVHKDWEKTLCPTIIGWTFDSSAIEGSDELTTFYRTHFPITSISYTGPGYRQSKWTWFDNSGNNYDLDYQPINKKKQTLTQYIQYLVDAKNGEMVDKIENPLDVSQYITNTIPIVTPDSASQYYYRTPKGGAVALTCVGVALPLLLAPFTFGVSVALSAIASCVAITNAWRLDTKWDNKGGNTQTFEGGQLTPNGTYSGFHDLDCVYYAKSTTAYDDWYAINQQRIHAAPVSDVKVYKTTSESQETCPTGYTDWKTIDGVKVCYQTGNQHPDTNELHDYFDYYSKIGLTYKKARSLASSLENNRTLTFTDGYLRPVTSATSPIDHDAQYYILFTTNYGQSSKIIFSGENNITSCLDATGRLSTVKYYFLYNNMSKLDMSSLKDSLDWSSYGSCDESTYEFTIKNRKAIIFKLENYSEILLDNNVEWKVTTPATGKLSEKDIRWTIYNGTSVYNTSTQSEIDFSQCEGLVKGFYQHSTADSGWTKISSPDDVVWEDVTNSIESTKLYSRTDTNEYNRVFTINQLKNNKSAWYIADGYYETESINPQNEYDLKIYLHQETYNVVTDTSGNTSLVLDTQLENTFVKEYPATFDFSTTGTNITVSFTDEDKTYTRKVDFTQTPLLPISNISNGYFWLLYNSCTDHPILFEEAAAIETELTQYWTSAYNASLYCEYFLPPSWQTRVDGGTNYYNQNIITYTSEKVANEDRIVFKDVVLSNKYLPDVAIYQENGSIKFPNYQFEHGTSGVNYKLGSLNQASNLTSYKNASILSNFTPLINALSELDDTIDSFTIADYNLQTNIGKKNYYYNANPSSGTKWNNFIQQHSNLTTEYTEHNGLYAMMYRILKKQFENRPFEKYSNLKSQQSNIWDNLYKQYPGIFLEESYSNKNATSSYELFSLASIAFKDKQEPEKGYSISLINPAQDLLVKDGDSMTYKRYSGQELKVGEGILLNADEYYDNYDDVYKTLSQYLFISDITYDLRKDSDIQVTVNSIKYQDKLIQRLAKLIK